MSALTADSVAELVDGLGQSCPGPLFLIDDAGRLHPLNARGRQMDSDDGSARAFVSAVRRSGDERGKVIGYVPHEAADAAPLVAAVVALVARVLGRGGPAADGKPPTSELVEAAREALQAVSDEESLGDILCRAVATALDARACVLLANRTGEAGLRPVAEVGAVSTGTVLGGELECWSALHQEPSLHRSGDELPPGVKAGRLPVAVIPLRCGPAPAGLLVVAGLPEPLASDSAFEAALGTIAPLLDKAAAALGGLRLVRQLCDEQKVQRELEVAQQVQSCLLRDGDWSGNGLELAGECRSAARIGGDWFGHRSDAEGRLVAGLFDVAGHGIGAAFCMASVRSILDGELSRGSAPWDVLSHANEVLCADLSGSGLYATAFLARWDGREERLDYASAGHAPPVHWRAEERRFESHAEGGLPLGLLPGGAHAPATAPFANGDVLVAYTDGIVEARAPTGEKFGRHRLLGAVHRLRRRSARGILRGLWAELERFVGDEPMHDDATVVVVRGARGGHGRPDEEKRP